MYKRDRNGNLVVKASPEYYNHIRAVKAESQINTLRHELDEMKALLTQLLAERKVNG